MNPIHENIDQYADQLIHQLLTEVQQREVLDHCDQCEDCHAALHRARQRLDIFQAVELDDVSEELLRRSLDFPESLGHQPDPSSVDAQKATNPKKPSLGLFLERSGWGLLAAAAVLLFGFNLLWSIQSAPSINLTVFGQNELFSNSDAAIRVVVQDGPQPVSSKRVHIDLSNQQQKIRLVSFVTDQHGTGAPRFRLPDWPEGRYQLTVALDGSEEDTISRSIELKRNWQLMLSTDKSVYQPGQTIHIRSLAKKRSGPIAGKTVTYRIADAKGNLIAVEHAVTSDFGISSMDVPLANEVNEGAWSVESEIEGVVSQATVNVQRYVLPKFTVAAEFSRPWYEPDQMVRGTIESKYFFGKAVDGRATIQQKSQLPGQTNSTNLELASIDVTDGKGKFEFPIPSGLIGLQRDADDALLQLRVLVTDSAGQTESKEFTVRVTRAPLKLELVPESPTRVAGTKNRLFIFTNYADGTPAKARVSIAGMDTTIQTNRFGVASVDVEPVDAPSQSVVVSAVDAAGHQVNRKFDFGDILQSDSFVLRTDKAVYRGGETVLISCFGQGRYPVMIDILRDNQTVLTSSIAVEQGRGELAFDLPADFEGALQINAYRLDTDGVTLRKARTVFVSSANQLQVNVAGLDQPRRPGEMAQLKFRVTDPQGQPAPAAISVSIVDAAVSAVASQRLGFLTTLAEGDAELLKPLYAIYPWLPSLGSGEDDQRAFEQAAFVRLDSLQSNRNEQLAILVNHQLEGETNLLDILDDPDIDEISENMPWIPKEDLQSLRSGKDYSISARSLPRKRSRFKRNQYYRQQITKTVTWIIVAGCIVMAVVSLQRRIGLWVTDVIGILIVVAILIGMLLPPVQRVREAATRTQKLNKFRQLGIALENARSNLDASRDAEATAPRVRKWFPETLLWKPQLITDDQGELELTVPLADSITTWKVNTQAVSRSGQLGGSVDELAVFQPFFIDANLPVAFTRGDQVSVPVVVYNYLSQPQMVKISIADAPWFEFQGPREHTLTIDAGQLQSVFFPIEVTQAGNHRLRITGIGSNDVADAIEKQVQVDFEGAVVEKVFNGTMRQRTDRTITVAPTAIDGSGQVILKVYPSKFSQLVEGLDGIFQRPNGCFEQTSSTIYPSVLALDYLKSTRQSVPEVELKAIRYIQEGYQRLLTFEVPGGGFEWFGRSPANVLLTAYGLMEFRDMNSVFSIDPDLLKRTSRWLLSQRNRDGSWGTPAAGRGFNRTVGADDRLAATAYVAWAIYGQHHSPQISRRWDATKKYLLSHRPAEVASTHTLALVCNALLSGSEGSEVQPWVDELLRRSKSRNLDGQQHTWWENGQARTTFFGSGDSAKIETTATAVLALLKCAKNTSIDISSDRASCDEALRWLVAQRDSRGTWHTTQATVLSLKALLAGTNQPANSPSDRHITVSRDGNVIRTLNLKSGQPIVQQVVLNNLDAGETFRLSLDEALDESGPSGFGFQITTRHHTVAPDADPESPLAIDLLYAAEQLKVGDWLPVTATVQSRMQNPAAMVMVTLPIPAGFEIQTRAFDQLVAKRQIEKFEQTPQSVVLYLRAMEPGEQLTFDYQLKARMPVKVTSPPAAAWLYYQPEVEVRGGETQLWAQ